MKRFKVNNIYIFCENYNREFKTKLELSVNMLDLDGIDSVYIGDQRQLYFLAKFHLIKNGIVLLKSAQKYVRGYLKKLKKNNILFLQDEEGLVSLESSDGKVKSRNDIDNLKLIDEIFCWNENELNTYKLLDESLQKKVTISGNLRTSAFTDFSKVYCEEIEKINEKYREYILIIGNGKLAFSNMHEPPVSKIIETNAKKNGQGQEHVQSVQSWSKNMIYSYFHLFDFVAKLQLNDKFRHTSIVFRPHPGENKELLKKLFEDVDNVSIEDDYAVAPWLVNAKAVIGSGSTVILESLSLSKPTFSLVHDYKNKQYEKVSNMLPNKISITASDADDLLSKLTSDNPNEFEESKRKVREICSSDVNTYRVYRSAASSYCERGENEKSNMPNVLRDLLYSWVLKVYDLASFLKSSKMYTVNHNKKYAADSLLNDMGYISNVIEGKGFKFKLISGRLLKIYKVK